ncbi:o-succinylbenzoate--CoA ligase [Sphingobium sp. TA15]|uniref:Putative fatty-acid-CoA ligase n=1 Tax=Sphingobium indicum (strain DSM 16413 / CCM 7287 / MTCC 6362 / UT26 / NBRC 101211 / UT26S) TaxID=452662 RepID=D4Z0V9_SPHIU|nr:AMP-binding protein [Sphingobium indicum]BAI96241.1 putative fatty-acid-CoA ligase [Sphingobium indicum UT26S]BDD65542.1 o-succinylbenzoate--CoA ligase [Sphingobium sp. TA15]
MLIIEHFEHGVAQFPDRAVLIDDNGSMSYKEMAGTAWTIAQALLRIGLPADSSVALLSPNHRMVLACQYGTLKAGAVWVPVNYRNSVFDNVAQLAKYDTRVLFFHSSLREHALAIKAAIPDLRAAICIDMEVEGFPALSDWCQDKAAQELPFPARAMEDPIAILSTGGTTGEPKGAVHTNRSFETVISTIYALFPFDEPPVHLVVAPLTHAAAVFHYALLPRGGTHVLLSSTDPVAVLQAIERHKISVVYLPPTLIYMILAHPRLKEFNLSSLRYLMYGAAPMSVEKLREAAAVFGPILIQSYGQTECLMFTTALTPRDHAEILSNPAIEHRIASVGRSGPFARTEVMTEDGEVAADGEVGEIAFRSSMQMTGFYKDADATNAIRKNGWQFSGDLGRRDADGYIYVVDRKRDMIISGGFNVFPGEVEQVVLGHPSVQDCAVVGTPDDKWGEMVTAVVELKPGSSIDTAEFLTFCKSKLGSVKAPKRVDIWPELPRSTVGKTLRRVVRDHFWANQQRKI